MMLLHPTIQNRMNDIQTISSILQSAAASLSDVQSRIIYIAIFSNKSRPQFSNNI